MKSRRIHIFLVIAVVLAIVTAGCGTTPEQKAAPAPAARKIPVTVEAVKKGEMYKSIPLGGLLQPQDEVYIVAKTPTARIMNVPVKIGDTVSKGTPLVYFDSRELDLQLNQAQLSYDRNKLLFESGAVSEYQLEQMKYTLDNLKIQKENMVLVSPIAGVVSTVSAVEGQLAGSASLVTVVNIDKLKLQVQVGEANIGKLKIGAEMPVTVSAASSEPYKGRITAVAPQIDSKTKAYPVTLEVENRDMAIKGGMYGEVQLVVDSRKDAISVPQYALLDQGQDKIVYVVENNTAKMRKVQVGMTLGTMAEITSGLQAGEMLIVEGQYAVRDGAPVVATVRGEKK